MSPPRNYGLPSPDEEWSRPKGCTCRTLRHAQGCFNRCDDSLTETRTPLLSWVDTFVLTIGSTLIFAGIIWLLLIMATRTARSEEAPKPPLYCRPLARFDHSCFGVKAAVRALGEARAEALARRCGATDEEIMQARECLRRND